MAANRRNRQQQHRPAREVVHAREVADLKRENHKLARKNAQLRKELTRAIVTHDGFEVVDTAVAPRTPIEGPVLTAELLVEAHEKSVANLGGPQQEFYPLGTCPKCRSQTHRLELGPKTIDICPECKWRHAVK